MKITQQAKFQPIIITLETKKEASVLWDAVLAFDIERYHSQLEKDTVAAIANWFSNNAQLGGE